MHKPFLRAWTPFAVAMALMTMPLNAAQPPVNAPEEQRAAMAKLAYMAGDWQGDGWIASREGRTTFRGGERVQAKLDGLALLVEGSFFSKDAATGRDVPSHTTLGVISFDPKTKSYRFSTWLATGTTGEREINLTADGWQWEVAIPRGTIRYTAKFTDSTWTEIGERVIDGGAPQKFFEMTLTKR